MPEPENGGAIKKMDDIGCYNMAPGFLRYQLRLLFLLFFAKIGSRDISAATQLLVRGLRHGESLRMVLRRLPQVSSPVARHVRGCFPRSLRLHRPVARH